MGSGNNISKLIGFYMKQNRLVLSFSKRKSTVQHGIKKTTESQWVRNLILINNLIIVYKKEQLF